MKEKVEEAINKIRPMLQADGGDVVTGCLCGVPHVADDVEKRNRKNTEKRNSGSGFRGIGTLETISKLAVTL
jgi:hypothetical protein